MKKQFIKTALWLALGATSTLGFVACNNDDNGGGGTTILVEDGFYIKGAGTALTELDAVITSYSIHYTKLYEVTANGLRKYGLIISQMP